MAAGRHRRLRAKRLCWFFPSPAPESAAGSAGQQRAEGVARGEAIGGPAFLPGCCGNFN